jgi:hypothetical protein
MRVETSVVLSNFFTVENAPSQDCPSVHALVLSLEKHLKEQENTGMVGTLMHLVQF